MSRVPSQTQSSRSYHYGHHPMVTSPGTRSAHLTGRFFPPQQAREHVTDQVLHSSAIFVSASLPLHLSPPIFSAPQSFIFESPSPLLHFVATQRLTTPGLIAKPWVPGNNDPLNSTNRAEHAWRGFPTDGTGYNQSARPLPPRPASQFSGVSTHAAEFRHVQPVDPPGMRVHMVAQPRIPAYQPAEPVRESVARRCRAVLYCTVFVCMCMCACVMCLRVFVCMCVCACLRVCSVFVFKLPLGSRLFRIFSSSFTLLV
jgi:hypothetical protein